MVETLTESFCERCGTRYEFRAPTRLNPLRKTRGLFGGLKNYLTSQDALGDAIGDAMRSEEDQLAAAQLDAFHETFNFCIGCRQYTCVNCWNDDDGRCRTCSPIAGTDDLAERLLAIQPTARPAATPPPSAEPMLAGDELSRRLGLDGWASSDAQPIPAGTNGDTVHAWPGSDPLTAGESGSTVAPEPEPLVAHVELEPEPMVAEVETEPEPMVAEVETEPELTVAEAEPEPMVAAEPEPAFEPVVADASQPWVEHEPEARAEPEASPVETAPEPIAPALRVVAWETDSAYDIVEPTAEIEPAVAEMEAAELEPELDMTPAEPVADVEPEQPAAETIEPEPEPEPTARVEDAPKPVTPVAPISETILHFPARPAPESTPVDEPVVAAEAESPELAARRAQLDLLGLGDPGEGPLSHDRPAVLPYRSRGASATPTEIAMLAGGTGFWEASAREVAGVTAQIGVQNCGECGLSLSATARFCRRCGTRQARSA